MNYSSKAIAVLLAALYILTVVYCDNNKLTKERIAEWHDKLYESTNALNSPGGGASGLRGWAMMVIAQYEAVNLIENKYQPYAINRNQVPNTINLNKADPLAAAAKAAQVVLDGLFNTPARKFAHLSQFVIQTGGLPNNEKTRNGIALGEFVGQQVLALRSNDGHPPNNNIPVVNGTNFDEYIYGTPYFPGAPNSPGYPSVRPFGIPSYTDARFAIPAPPARNSETWKVQWKELYTYGTSDPSKSARTQEKDDIARFHDGNFGSQISWASDVLITSNIDVEGLDLLRILALTSMSSHDAHATHWYYKYFFKLARPITAYRLVPATYPDLYTERDANWTPLLTTSQTPEYPSGHASRTGGVTASFIKAFGNNVSFKTISYTQPNQGYRSYTSFSQFQDEVQISRTYGGVHWRQSGISGRQLAQSVTDYIWANYLKRRN